MPKLDTTQRLGLPVHAPERAHVPSQTLAHGPQYSRSGLFDRDRFRQNLRDRVLHAKAFLGAFAVLDVVGGPVPLDDLAVLVARSDTIDAEPAILSVGTPDALLGMPRLAGGKGVTPHFLAGRDVVGMRHDGPFRAERSLVGKPCVLFPGGVDEVAPGVCRIARHRDWDGIDHLPQLAPRLGELSLSLAQHILRTLALRQIEHEGGALVTTLFKRCPTN